MAARGSSRPPHSDRGSQSQRGQRGQGGSRNVLASAFGEQRSNRVVILFIAFLAIAAVLGIRLLWLQVIDAGNLTRAAENSRTINVTVSPHRGTIYDRNGNVLAHDVNATTIYCNPTEIKEEDVSGIAKQLAALLEGDPEYYEDCLTKEATSFAYIERKADAEKAEQVRSLGVHGLYFLSETKREYPYGHIAGQILGLVDVDGNGITGLELYYDDVLGGEPGSIVMEQGASGLVISGSIEKTHPVDGKDIVLTIDIEMQKYVEEHMADVAENMGGQSAQVIMMDSKTGEMIAACSTPYLNPNDRTDIKEGATELKCVTTAFEPGSIFKPVVVTAALQEDVVTPDTKYDCPAKLPADEYYISDAHEREDVIYTVREIIQNSSNVGLSLIAKDLGFETMYDYINEYGLNMDFTGIDYPGEASGYLSNYTNWSTIQGYNVAFGQGISLTPIQITRFYGALNNNGIAQQPHFLKKNMGDGTTVETEGTKIIDDEDALADMNSMLVTVVEDGGTGEDAQIKGYTVAGKTGTAEYVSEGSYAYVKGSYNLSFVGYLPKSDSGLICFVGVTHVPAMSTTTIFFRDIMSYAIDRYNITE